MEATDKHTVVFTFKEYNAEWDYRFGYGLLLGHLCPRRWPTPAPPTGRTSTAPAPSCSTDFVQGNSNTYVKNPIYWDKEKINGGEYKLPFVDKLVYRTIKDEATFITALRTGKLDILEAIRWQNVDELKKNAPQLKWSRWLNMSGTFLALRVDTKPFDDIRVRRALNMAVNKQEIVNAYYNGNAELFAYPHASRLQRLLRAARGDAGERQGAVHLQPRQGQEAAGRGRLPQRLHASRCRCAPCNPDHMDLLPLVAAYLEKVGVKIEIQPMEYAAFLSAMTSSKMTPGYFMNNGHTNPTTTIRKSFTTGQRGTRRAGPIPPTTRRWTRCTPSATRASARPCSRR